MGRPSYLKSSVCAAPVVGFCLYNYINVELPHADSLDARLLSFPLWGSLVTCVGYCLRVRQY